MGRVRGSLEQPQNVFRTLKPQMSEQEKSSQKPGEFEQILVKLKAEEIVNLNDFPSVNIDFLNRYLSSNPLETDKERTIVYYEVDEENELIAQQTLSFEHEAVATKIAIQLWNWNRYTVKNGRVTTGHACFQFANGLDQRKIRLMPDAAFVSADVFQSLTEAQMCTYTGEPFSPLFVLEVDTLTEGSTRLAEVEREMEIYFEKGQVRLAWAIDPKNKLMYTYSNEEVGAPAVRSSDSTWRDLDGGDILPGFVVRKKELDRAISGVVMFNVGTSTP